MRQQRRLADEAAQHAHAQPGRRGGLARHRDAAGQDVAQAGAKEGVVLGGGHRDAL